MINSTVTISIEEFEDLIENKKKVEEIKKVMKEHSKSLFYINIELFNVVFTGYDKKAKELIENGDTKNIKTLIKINDILEAKNESRDKRQCNN